MVFKWHLTSRFAGCKISAGLVLFQKEHLESMISRDDRIVCMAGVNAPPQNSQEKWRDVPCNQRLQYGFSVVFFGRGEGVCLSV